jgi:uncharacterized protein YcfL
MKQAALVSLSLCVLVLSSCKKEQPVPRLDALQFPVAVLFANSSTRTGLADLQKSLSAKQTLAEMVAVVQQTP